MQESNRKIIFHKPGFGSQETTEKRAMFYTKNERRWPVMKILVVVTASHVVVHANNLILHQRGPAPLLMPVV